jgi:hypothetical protein
MEGGFWNDVMAQFNAMQPSASGWDGGQQVVKDGQRYRSAATTQMNSDGTSTYTGGGDQYVSAPDAPWAQGQMGNLHDASGNVTESWELENPYAMDWQEKLILAGLALGGGAAAMGLGGAGAGAGAAGAGGTATMGAGAAGAGMGAAEMAAGAGLGFGAPVGAEALAAYAGLAGTASPAAMAAAMGMSPEAFAALGAGGLGSAGGAAGMTAGTGAAGAGGNSLWKTLVSTLAPGGSGSGGLDWSSLIGPAAQLVGGAVGAKAADKASDAQLQATREAAALQEPFRQGGMAALNRLLELNGIGGNPQSADYGSAQKSFSMADYQADPGLEFRRSEGERALQRAASANGTFGSGKYLKDAMSYNSGLASQEYNNAFNRFQTSRASKLNPLQSLMGAGQTAANTIGDLKTQGGNAQAAGTVGKANAWGNALSQGASMYSANQDRAQENSLMNRWFASRGI